MAEPDLTLDPMMPDIPSAGPVPPNPTSQGWDDVIGHQLAAGDHVCAFYRSPQERDVLLLPFLAEGVTAGTRCICVVDSCAPADVLARLAGYVDVDVHTAQGRLEVLHADESYLQHGGFLPEEMLRFWESKARATTSSPGHGVVRNIGDMSWAHRDKPGVENLAYYESALNRVMRNYPQVTVCLYDLTRCDGQLVMDVLKTHPKVMIGSMVVDNPYYLDPDEFLALDRERWLTASAS